MVAVDWADWRSGKEGRIASWKPCLRLFCWAGLRRIWRARHRAGCDARDGTQSRSHAVTGPPSSQRADGIRRAAAFISGLPPGSNIALARLVTAWCGVCCAATTRWCLAAAAAGIMRTRAQSGLAGAGGDAR